MEKLYDFIEYLRQTRSELNNIHCKISFTPLLAIRFIENQEF